MAQRKLPAASVPELGRVDLAGGDRRFVIANGPAVADLTIEVPLANGSLTKAGQGTLALQGSSLYAGDTTVQQGVLSLNQALLADSADVYLEAGGILDLDFSGNPDVIRSLFFAGESAAVGTWGGLGSGAQFVSPLIAGTGWLEVTQTLMPGDFDANGSVDSADLGEWQAGYGLNSLADADGDGDSDGHDYLIWLRNYTGPELAGCRRGSSRAECTVFDYRCPGAAWSPATLSRRAGPGTVNRTRQKMVHGILRVVLLASVLMGAREAAAEFSDSRTLFVNRFEYGFNTSSITTIMQNAADLGITDVMFQVRGRADAFYDSNFEPLANGLSASFDPLQTAIDAAHARGIKLHAWLNATPMWNTTVIDPPAGHIFNQTDPSFRLTDINGNVEPQAGWSNYSSVNPVLPEVHTHINQVVNDISTNYAVDGIHLDYIRYIPGPSFDRLPHDPLSHQIFQTATGLDGSNAANATAYRDFVKGRITDLVASVKQTVDAAEVGTGRTMELTASVWRDPDVGESDYMQDYRTWLEQDLLDVAMPMIYLNASNDGVLFNPNLLNTLRIPTNSRVSPTLGVYLHTASGGGVELTKSQLDRAYLAGSDGITLYGYSAMFIDSLAAERRAAFQDYFAQIAAATPGNVLDDFELDEGHFAWPYNHSPTSQTFGLAAATTIEQVTTVAQAGSGSQELESRRRRGGSVAVAAQFRHWHRC